MIIADIAAALAVGILSGMGVGGGGLLVVYLTVIRNMPQIHAQGINLIFFICASVSALSIHLKKRKIDVKLAITLSAAGIIGSFPGTFLARILPGEVTSKIFGIVLLLSGIITLYRLHLKKKRISDAHKKR